MRMVKKQQTRTKNFKLTAVFAILNYLYIHKYNQMHVLNSGALL